MPKVVINTSVEKVVDMSIEDYENFLALCSALYPSDKTEDSINTVISKYVDDVDPKAFSTVDLVQ